MKINSLRSDSLDEVKMSPTALELFADSDVAKTAKFGFEAEMLVPDLENLTGDEGIRVPDFDKDEPFPTSGMWNSKIFRFFTSGDWQNNRQAVGNAISRYQDDYFSWLESDFELRLFDDLEPLIRKELSGILKTTDADAISQSIDSEDIDFDRAKEIVKDRFMQRHRFAEFAKYKRIVTMRDFMQLYSLNSFAWPYTKLDNVTQPGKSLDELEYDLVMDTGFTVTTSKIYHLAARNTTTWILEPDSSIEPDSPDYGGIELVSPTMSLIDGLAAMDTFFKWAHSYGIKTNDTTGFHINLSLPKDLMSKLDPIKLVLFIGDNYILKQFDRINNQYAKSLIDHLDDRVRARSRRWLIDIPMIFDQIKRRLDVIAVDALSELLPNQDRHVSINIKDKYIEFRSAGGDYINRHDDIRLTVLRCVRALAIACDPTADQQEYAKKLYKAFGKYSPQKQDIVRYFVEYASGIRDKNSLKAVIKDIQQTRSGINESQNVNMPLNLSQLDELLAIVREQQETANDHSYSVRPDTDAYKQIENDYRALTAIEYVIKNNIKAIKNPKLQAGAVFVYDWDGYEDSIGAIQLQITNSVAEIKWLGSYNSSGKQLIARGLEQAKAMGATKVNLTSKWGSGQYYKKQGFTPTTPEVDNPLTDTGAEYTKDIKEYSVRSYIKQPIQTDEAAATVDQLLQRYSDMPGDPNNWVANKVKKLDNIINTLRNNAYAPELKLFGDVTNRDDTVPDEVSFFIDINRIPLSKEIMHNALNDILNLSARYRGMVIPYILVGKQLWTKNDDSTTWIKDNNSYLISQGKRGLPITLFDRSFVKIAYAGLSENRLKNSVLEWVTETAKHSALLTDQSIVDRLKNKYTINEIAVMIGGH